MTYDRHYMEGSREANDEKALQDCREYCDQKTWELVLIECGRVVQLDTAQAFQDLNMALGFVGISGYPVHAIGRAFCLASYRKWMAEGPKGIATDEKGWRLEEGEGK